MAVVIPQFDPTITVVNTLSGGVNTIDRSLLLSQGTAQARAAESLQARFASRIDEALARLNDAGSSAIADGLLREQAGLASRKARVTEAIQVVSKALGQFQYLKSHISYLQDQLDSLENGDITASSLAVDWDNKLRKINQLASGGATSIKDGKAYYHKNLIDSLSRTSFSTQTLFAPYNSRGDTLRIDGIYLGTDYFITDGDGDFWNSTTGYVESEAAVGTLSEYTSYPSSATGTSDSVDAITLDSFDSGTDTATFTLSDATQISGTVTRGGLGLLDAFLYGNFDTAVDADAITRARADLQEAEGLVLAAEAEFRQNLTTLQSRASVFDGQIAGLTTEIADLIQDLRDEREAELLVLSLEFQVAQFDFVLLASRGNSLVRSFILAQDNAQSPYRDTIASGERLVGAAVNIRA